MSTTILRFVCFLLSVVAFGKACGPSEYRSASGECCPMCNIGSVVLRDCSGDLSTTCKPCPPGTFISEPNGLHNCLTCRNCDESQGLYIQSKCTTIKDTMCDVLDGYHCIDYSDSQCRHAQKHSVCEPGQETKRPGTKTLDTICVNCPQGFFSPSGLNCTKWTDCTSRNEIQTEIGSSVKDVTCTQKRRGRYGLIFPVALTSLLSIILCLWLMYKSCKFKGDKTVKNKLFPKNRSPCWISSGPLVTVLESSPCAVTLTWWRSLRSSGTLRTMRGSTIKSLPGGQTNNS